MFPKCARCYSSVIIQQRGWRVKISRARVRASYVRGGIVTTQSSYTQDEWNCIAQAPGFVVTFIIQSVGYSAPVALHKMFVGVDAILKAAEPESDGELVHAVRASIMAGQRPQHPVEIPANRSHARQIILDGCRQITVILSQRTPEPEADAYLGWLLEIARMVAAVPSAPTLPIDRVDLAAAQERAALEALATALGVCPPGRTQEPPHDNRARSGEMPQHGSDPEGIQMITEWWW